MSVPLRSNLERERGSSLNSVWISEEESIKKSLENLTKDLNRRRSCSPNIVISSDVTLPCITSSAEKLKKQVGMDRYITVVKRQRSPNSAKVTPSPKLSKNINSGKAPDQNRFALLQTDEPTTVVNSSKPPPIYLREPTSSELVNKLITIIGENSFAVTSIKRGNINETKIQVNKVDDFRKLTNNLEKDRREFYTYQLKSAKGLQVVLKGIDPCADPEEIKSGLIDKGFKIKSIQNIRNRDKIPQPMFRVELEPGDLVLKKNEVHPIYNLKFLLYRRITVEEPHKRRGPVQCFNCQEFGHTKSYCKLPSVCVACGELHGVAQCKKPKTDSNVKRCSNCGGNHTANYRGCPVYTHFKRSITNKPSIAHKQFQQQNYALGNNFPRIGLPTSQGNTLFPDKVSYADVLKSNDTNVSQKAKSQQSNPPINNLEATLNTLVQSLNVFTASMTSMMQEMLKMQSTILQAIMSK